MTNPRAVSFTLHHVLLSSYVSLRFLSLRVSKLSSLFDRRKKKKKKENRSVFSITPTVVTFLEVEREIFLYLYDADCGM